MTTKQVTLKAKNAGQLIGKHISFDWTDGWDDWPQSGYLHGLSIPEPHTEGYVYFYLDDDPVLTEGETAENLGGVGEWPESTVTFTVRVN